MASCKGNYSRLLTPPTLAGWYMVEPWASPRSHPAFAVVSSPPSGPTKRCLMRPGIGISFEIIIYLTKWSATCQTQSTGSVPYILPDHHNEIGLPGQKIPISVDDCQLYPLMISIYNSKIILGVLPLQKAGWLFNASARYLREVFKESWRLCYCRKRSKWWVIHKTTKSQST